MINGVIVFLRDYFHLTENVTAVTFSSLPAGCVIGAAVAGWPTDDFGCRLLLAISALLFGLSSLGAALCVTFVQFEIAPFAGDLAIGVALMLAPFFIAEHRQRPFADAWSSSIKRRS